jgi:regulatory protein
LAELGYLDDAVYAHALVDSRSTRRGARAIAAELHAKGVSREDSDAALAGLDPEAELAAAVLLARRLLRAPAGREEQQRAAAALARRGFAFSVARAAIALILGERAAELD